MFGARSAGDVTQNSRKLIFIWLLGSCVPCIEMPVRMCACAPKCMLILCLNHNVACIVNHLQLPNKTAQQLLLYCCCSGPLQWCWGFVVALVNRRPRKLLVDTQGVWVENSGAGVFQPVPDLVHGN